MPKLTDFNPQWVNHGDCRGLGLLMTAPNDASMRLLVLFANPLDGGQPWPGESRSLILELFPEQEQRLGIVGCGTCRWQRSGDSFEGLSLTPSVDAHELGHFTVTNGGW